MPEVVRKRAPRKKKVVAEGRDGVEVLTDEASKELVKSSNAIARGLVRKAKEGNASSTKFLLDLATRKKTTKQKLPSRAVELGKEKEWQGSAAGTTEDSE